MSHSLRWVSCRVESGLYGCNSEIIREAMANT